MAKMDTYRLGWRGAEYDIPMTATKRAEIDKLVAGLVNEGGENVKVIRTGEAHKIREWAENNGYQNVKGKRGRISRKIQEAYAAAMKKNGAKGTATKAAPAKATSTPAKATAPKASPATGDKATLSTKGAAAKAAVVASTPAEGEKAAA